MIYDIYDNVLDEDTAKFIDTEMKKMTFKYDYNSTKGAVNKHWHTYCGNDVIKEEYRRQGVGSILFEETIKICNKLKLNGMSWQVLDWNQAAINFYKKYNAEIKNDWLNGKLTKKQIQELCSQF